VKILRNSIKTKKEVVYSSRPSSQLPAVHRTGGTLDCRSLIVGPIAHQELVYTVYVGARNTTWRSSMAAGMTFEIESNMRLQARVSWLAPIGPLQMLAVMMLGKL